jgi:hypothetical protein
MMRKIIGLFLFAFLILISPKVKAAVSPLSLNLVPPIEFPPEDVGVTGARISILWGQHRNVYGLDLGLLGNITSQEFVGVSISGIFNMTHGPTTALGVQLAGLTNINTGPTRVFGAQLALGMNVNTAASSVSGLQAALLGNISTFTNIYGVQLGLFNRAQEVYGLQVGLVNMAEDLHGVQIGLVNFNKKGLFAVAPILNIGF